MKTSRTMRKKHTDNFAAWRARNVTPLNYSPFKRNEVLAELIGVTLGDGHIEKFPRTERLIISAHSLNKGFIRRYAKIVEHVFWKQPCLMKVKRKRNVRISVYQKHISKRLGIPTGNRRHSTKGIPAWVFRNKKLLIACLRGLYEAEGSFNIHAPTYTYKASFSNRNPKLLKDVYNSLQKLGFSPLYEKYRIMVSRKNEFFALKELIHFREYWNLRDRLMAGHMTLDHGI